MSEKIQLEMTHAGELDSMSNPVLMNGRGSRLLQDIGDLDGDGLLRTQPGVSKVLGAPLLADYAAGTVTVSNGSKSVVGSSTAFLANAFPGEIFVGPDGTYYTIKSVESDTALTLRTKYAGTSAAGGAYSVKHVAWMLAPFYTANGSLKTTQSQSYASATVGTFTNTRATKYGVALTQSFESLHASYSYSYGNVSALAVPGSTMSLTGTINGQPLGTAWEIRFTVDANVSTTGIWLTDMNLGGDSGMTYVVSIQTQTGDVPSGSVVTNATTGAVNETINYAATGLRYWYAFSGAVNLVAGTDYWLVVNQVAGASTYGYLQFYPQEFNGTTTGTVVSTCRQYNSDSGVRRTLSPTRFGFGIHKYQTTGTNTYKGAVIDVGSVPVAAGTLAISVSTPSEPPDIWAQMYTTGFVCSETSRPDTLTWELNCSASSDMSTPTQVATGQTALNYTITGAANLKRYYQITYTMTSATGRSTPVVASASISFETSINDAKEASIFHLVGCGRNIYTQIKSGASTISTTAVPTGAEVRPVAYQGRIMWTTGGQPPRYWDGVAAADAAISAMLKSDATAGTDPPVRASGMCQHNDKIFLYGDVGVSYYTGVSTSQTATVMTNSSASFTVTGTGLQRFRVYPDETNWPLRWWPITSNTSTAVTVAGATMTDVAGAGDSYLVTKNYRKAAWYTDEVEPASWPSTSFLKFGDDDGDVVQAMVSWKDRLLAIFRDQIWRVTGFGPASPWEKSIMGRTGGTLSPRSVVASETALYWWGSQGIVEYTGSYTSATDTSARFRDLVLDDLNEDLRDNVTGVMYRGLCLWSYPSADSNFNNRTIVFNPASGRWVIRTFGMYAPAVFIDENQEEVLYFWDPLTSCICKYDATITVFASGTPQVVNRTAFVAASNPAERSQWRHLRMVVRSDGTEVISVGYALDYVDTYTNAGTMQPISKAASGRTSINSTDTIYTLDFPREAAGAAISLEITSSPSAAFKIMHVELTADPCESGTYA